MRYDLSSKLGLMQFELRCEALKKKGAKVELTERKQNRTISQNALFHLWLKIFSECVGETNLEKLKTDIKRHLLGRKTVINCINLKEELEDYHTSRMSVDEMTDFLNKFKAFAMTDYGCYLPNPGEVGYEEMLSMYL